LIRAIGELDPACLAPATGLDLRFYHHSWGTGGREVRGDRAGLLRRASDASLRHGNAVLPEQLFRLKLKQVHCCPSSVRLDSARKPIRADTPPAPQGSQAPTQTCRPPRDTARMRPEELVVDDRRRILSRPEPRPPRSRGCLGRT